MKDRFDNGLKALTEICQLQNDWCHYRRLCKR